MYRLVLCLVLASPAFAQPAPEKARDLLEAALQDHNPDTRKLAATALGLGGPHEPFLKLVEDLLNDKDVEVRVTAIGSLADWKTRSAAPMLRKSLDDPVPEVSFAAARAL